MKTEIEFLKEIVHNAEEISKKHFVVKSKGGEADLVTNLDTEIETYLISEINKEYPDFDIVSEEFNSNHEKTDNCFIIDPIDGTINFANNLPLWGIQIACVKNGETVASVIDLPRINEFYWADSTGAYLNDVKIGVKVVPIKNTLYSIDGKNTLSIMQRMRKYSSNRRNLGALCVSMSFVASGKIHGSVFTSNNPWDYEPGIYICKMAGASICDRPGFHAAAMNKEFLDILELETAKKQGLSNIFLLHSLNGDTLEMWGKDVKDFFTTKEVDTIMPTFPIRENSTYDKFKEILSFYIKNGQLNEQSVIIAHSIANPYFIRFCRELKFIPKAYIAVAPGGVYRYPRQRTDYIVQVLEQSYLEKEDLEFVKNSIKEKYCIYSDEDDNNIEKFTRFIDDTRSVSMYLKAYNHFDGYHRIYRIPELLELVNKLI